MESIKAPLKRITSLLMILVLLFCVTPVTDKMNFVAITASAEEFTEGDYTYTVTDGKATITRYNGDDAQVTIPEDLGGYPVTEIGESCFSAHTYDLYSVVIPDSVETIGSSAFSQCQRLSSVTFGSGLKTIGGYAFYNCAVNSPVFPEGLKSIGSSAFEKGCNGSIRIPSSVEHIYANAFYQASLGSITFGDGVGEVGDEAFYLCQGLGTVVFEGSVDSFGKNAFGKTYSNGSSKDVYVADVANWLNIKFENLYASPMGYGGTFYVNGKNIDGKLVIPEEISDCSGINLSMMGLKKVMLLNEKFPVSKFDSLSNFTVYAHDVNDNKESVENAGQTFVDLASFDCENGKHCYDFYGVTNIQEISCFQDGISTETCVLCGDVKETVTDKWEHQFMQNWSVTRYPTCSQEGLEYRTCVICREYKETRAIEKKAHSLKTIPAVSATCTSTGLTEGKKCSVCDEIIVEQETVEILSHSMGEWVTTQAPTCTATGTEKRECANCNYAETNILEATGHTEETIPAVSATCTTTGLTEGKKCSICGETTVAQQVVNKTAHKSDMGTVLSEPTCNSVGIVSYKCIDCSTMIDVVTVAKLPHTLGEWVTTQAPTCTATGTEKRECANCNYAETNTLKATCKHTSDKGTVTQKATYTTTGTKTYKCTVCKATLKNETIAKLTLGKVSGLKAKKVKVAKSSEITLTWNKVTGAEKYEIYQLNGKSWKKIKTTSSTSYTVKKLSANKSYKFRVRAVVDGASGAYSSVLTVKTVPATTSKLTLKAGSKQLTATWKSVSDISGYEVQYSTSSKMKNAKTVTAKKSATKTTIKKLTKGKKYYVRVRTYKTVNGKKVYSSWSTVKNVKVK